MAASSKNVIKKHEYTNLTKISTISSSNYGHIHHIELKPQNEELYDLNVKLEWERDEKGYYKTLKIAIKQGIDGVITIHIYNIVWMLFHHLRNYDKMREQLQEKKISHVRPTGIYDVLESITNGKTSQSYKILQKAKKDNFVGLMVDYILSNMKQAYINCIKQDIKYIKDHQYVTPVMKEKYMDGLHEEIARFKSIYPWSQALTMDELQLPEFSHLFDIYVLCEELLNSKDHMSQQRIKRQRND